MNKIIDIEKIIEMIPHRYPFLLIDRLLEVKEDDYAVGLKNVTINEPFFSGHFPGKKVMPGVLIIEALAQAAGILGFMTMNKTPEEGSIYYFAGVDKVRFKNPVIPGEVIDLHATIRSEKKGIWKFDCKAEVGGKNVCEATILCAYRPK